MGVLSVLAVTEAYGYGGGHYDGYWGKYYKPAGELLSAPSIANVDYGKTGIKYLKKREAEADPEADPWFYSTASYHPQVYGYPYASAYAAYPYSYGYAHAGYPYAYGYAGYPYVAVAKPKEE